MKNLRPFGFQNQRNDFFSDFDKIFENFLVPSYGARAKDLKSAGFTPSLDVTENEHGFLVSADLPGMDKEHIDIEVKDEALKISGERHYNHEETTQDGHFKSYERSFGKFERWIGLPKNVDTENIQARYENGVLEVMLPKKELSKSNKVKITNADGSLFSKNFGKTSKEVN